jgi:hypothetical protein
MLSVSSARRRPEVDYSTISAWRVRPLTAVANRSVFWGSYGLVRRNMLRNGARWNRSAGPGDELRSKLELVGRPQYQLNTNCGAAPQQSDQPHSLRRSRFP